MYEVFIKVRGERGEWVCVSDSRQASRAVRACIEASGVGASEWQGGAVRKMGAKKTLYRVSYNGRVWDARAYPHCEEAAF